MMVTNMMALKLILLPLTMTMIKIALATDSTPLMLTPYIESGDTDTARYLSRTYDNNCIPRSYSGYFTVDKKLGNHLFFWFFPTTSRSNPDAPLLLWLNGVPGTSSLLGLFHENGPLEVDPVDKSFKPRRDSWTKDFAVLYVDNPVGVGFSFSDSENGSAGVRSTQEGYGGDLHSFVKQFFKMFPEYKCRGFYIGGQSYVGHFAPVLAELIDQDLKNNVTDVPLTGIYLGAPFFNAQVMVPHYFEYLYSMGYISYASKRSYQRKAEESYQKYQNGTRGRSLSEIYDILFPSIGVMPGNVMTQENIFMDVTIITSLLSSDKYKNLLHVANRTYYPRRKEVMQDFGDDVYVPTSDKMKTLLNDYKVLIYTGDYDALVCSRAVDEALMDIDWDLSENFANATRDVWRKNQNHESSELLGFYSLTGNFCRVVVKGAGHDAPHDQPATCLKMMQDFVKHGCIHPAT